MIGVRSNLGGHQARGPVVERGQGCPVAGPVPQWDPRALRVMCEKGIGAGHAGGIISGTSGTWLRVCATAQKPLQLRRGHPKTGLR